MTRRPPCAWPRARHPWGFSLIELLCTLAIIAILATLLLGPASRILGKARAMQWGDRAGSMTEEIRQRLNTVFTEQTDFPEVSFERLAAAPWLTPSQLQFLRDRRVRFYPFRGADDPSKVVVQVEIRPGFLTSAGVLTITKGELTEPKH